MREREWQAQVLEAAQLMGWLGYHTHDSRRSAPGFPDLVLVRERVLFAELKTDTGRLRPEQATWLERLRDAGAEAYLWRPRNWDGVLDTLKRRGRG